MGRPEAITDTVVRKLEKAFEDGLNVTEACFISGISRDTYYRNTALDKGFSDKMSRSQVFLVSKAKANMAKRIKKNDYNASKWLLDSEARKAERTETVDTTEAEIIAEVSQEVSEAEAKDAMRRNAKYLESEMRKQLYHQSGRVSGYSGKYRKLSDKEIADYQKLEGQAKTDFAVKYFRGNKNLDALMLLTLFTVDDNYKMSHG